MRYLIPTLIGLLFPLIVSAETPASPNIILLIADDLGYGELGCQGNDQIPTPHIDSIAKNGVRFTDGYVTGPFCSSSRAGLMTGRYQTRFGYERNPIGEKNEDPDIGLPKGEITLAEMLQDRGYATGLVGKWHLGGAAPYHPFRNGFDEFFGFMHEGHYFVPPPYSGVTTMLRRKRLPFKKQGRWTSQDGQLVLSTHMGYNEPDYDADNPIYRGGQPVNEQAYLTDAFTREAVDFINRNQERPFFLCLAYNAVHSPLQGADRYMKKFAHVDDIHRRIFAAMLANMDDSVGDVLKMVNKFNLSERTLIVFISDNGGPTRELTSDNGPLRGEKGHVYEGGIRVPFLMQWKNHLPAGKTYREPVISLDIYATAVDLSGATIPQNKRLDGVNLLPYLNANDQGVPHESLFWRSIEKSAFRSGDWKAVRNPHRGQGGDWELYNLRADIGEQDDLKSQYPNRLEKMIAGWEKMNQEMIDPLW